MAVYTVKLERNGGELGFSVKGGKEHGIGILVSDVDPRGIAHDALEVGDEILYVNGTRLLDATHADAVQALRRVGSDLELTVQHHVNIQSALKTSQEDYEKMQSNFERMRERIRNRPLAPVQSMQGAPEPRPFPFPPFLPARWSTSRNDDATIELPTRETDSSLGQPAAQTGRQCAASTTTAGAMPRSSSQVLSNMTEALASDEPDGASQRQSVPQGRRAVEPRADGAPAEIEVRRGTLPEGWVQRMDPRSKQFYYENNWLGVSLWTDPRTLGRVPDVREYNWATLPAGWKKFEDKNGFVYYVNHHNHTTHWESPTMMRQSKLLADVKTHYQELDERMQTEAQTLKQKRETLLKNRDELQRLSGKREQMQRQKSVSESPAGPRRSSSSDAANHDVKHSLDGLLSAIVEEVMQLNETVEGLSTQISLYQKGLSSLELLRRQAQDELNSGRDMSTIASGLALQLHNTFLETALLHRQKLSALHRLEAHRQRQRRRSTALAGPDSLNPALQLQRRRSISSDDGECMSPDTSLLFMLQVPDQMMRSIIKEDPDDDNDDDDVIDGDSDDVIVTLSADPREQQVAPRVHILQDGLTVKCNLEMRVEIALLQQLACHSSSNLNLLKSWEQEVRESSQAWGKVVERLNGMDDLMDAVHFDWIGLPFKEKLKKVTSSADR